MEEPPRYEGRENGLRWQVNDLSRRMGRLEDKIDRFKLDVLVDRVELLSAELRSFRRSFITFAFGMVSASAISSLTIFLIFR